MRQAGHEVVDQTMKNSGNLLGAGSNMRLTLIPFGHSNFPEVGASGFVKMVLSEAIYKNIFLI